MNFDHRPFRITVPRDAAAPTLDADVERIFATEAGFVESCLPFDGMTSVPVSYDRFARMHFRRLRTHALSWPDVCPAYALAWLTHAAYGPDLDETRAREALKKAEEARSRALDKQEVAAVEAEIATLAAQLAALRKLRKG